MPAPHARRFGENVVRAVVDNNVWRAGVVDATNAKASALSSRLGMRTRWVACHHTTAFATSLSHVPATFSPYSRLPPVA